LNFIVPVETVSPPIGKHRAHSSQLIADSSKRNKKVLQAYQRIGGYVKEPIRKINNFGVFVK
jgi:hypothetical protein